MHPLKKPEPHWKEPTSGAKSLDESGVRRIPQAARAALAEIEARRAAQAKHELSIADMEDALLEDALLEDAPLEVARVVDVPVVDAHPKDKPCDPITQAPNTKVCPKLLESYLFLVHQVVAPILRRVPTNVLREDLLAAGFFGLVDSLRKNGGDGGVTFEWYARTRIRGAIFDELRAQDWLTRRARDAVNAAALRDSADAEFVTFIGVDELSVSDEQDFLASFEANPEDMYAAKEIKQLLAYALDKLPDRERRIVGMHYFEEARFKDIGAELGISETRAWQLHGRAIERLRGLFHENYTRREARQDVCRVMTESAVSQPGWLEDVPTNVTAPEEDSSHVEPAADVA